jgi:hypothetical protein
MVFGMKMRILGKMMGLGSKVFNLLNQDPSLNTIVVVNNATPCITSFAADVMQGVTCI